jgi:glycosyltransferase involved in cell wall biosynthesis
MSDDSLNTATAQSEQSEAQKPRPIRVLHVLTSPFLGGTERMVLRVLQHGQTDTVRHELAVLIPGDDVPRLAEEAGAQVYRGTQQPKPLGRWKALRQLLQREQFDIVQLYGLQADVLGRRAAKKSGAKVISSIRSTDPWRKWFHTFLDRSTAGHVDFWISNSQAGLDAMAARQPIDRSQAAVVYNGIEPPTDEAGEGASELRKELANQAGLTDDTDPLIFLCLANLRWMKGHHTLVRAFAQIAEQHPEAMLVLVGADSPPNVESGKTTGQELTELAADMNIVTRVIQTGSLNRPEGHLAAADIVVLASEHEGFPASLVEGMAHGCPLVATKVGGIPEMFVDGTHGYLVEPSAVDSLAQAMLRLAKSAERRSQMGNAARDHFQEKFTVENMTRELNKIYTRLAE